MRKEGSTQREREKEREREKRTDEQLDEYTVLMRNGDHCPFRGSSGRFSICSQSDSREEKHPNHSHLIPSVTERNLNCS
jgi:hypothetical protein